MAGSGMQLLGMSVVGSLEKGWLKLRGLVHAQRHGFLEGGKSLEMKLATYFFHTVTECFEMPFGTQPTKKLSEFETRNMRMLTIFFGRNHQMVIWEKKLGEDFGPTQIQWLLLIVPDL